MYVKILIEVNILELLQLTYFCSACETENFSKTAKAYSVPTSNISQSIHRLETELGITLFDRTSNSITLNEQGKIFYRDIKSALMLIHGAKEKLSEHNEVFGEIKILVETNRHLVTKTIEQFQICYSDVVFFINHSSEDVLEKYDLIITDRILEKKNFKKHLLIVENLNLAMKKSNPLSKKSSVSVKNLENEKFITMGNKSGLFKLTNEICNREGFTPNIVIQSDDPYYIRKYIEMGLGISFVPSLSWKDGFSDDVVSMRLVNAKRYTYVYQHTQKHMSKATSLFLNALLDTAKEYSKSEDK